MKKSRNTIAGHAKIRKSEWCAYCGSALARHEVHVDHFLPVCYSDEAYNQVNLLPSCQECNQIKSSIMFTDIYDARLYIQMAKEGRKDEYWANIRAHKKQKTNLSSSQK